MLLFLYPFLLNTALLSFQREKKKNNKGENCTTADLKRTKPQTTATSNNISSN
jgi:hypothetical protein